MGKILKKVDEKILERFMKKYWKNAKKNWKSQGNSSVQKSGNHEKVGSQVNMTFWFWMMYPPPPQE